jgi:hypothetical protein
MWQVRKAEARAGVPEGTVRKQREQPGWGTRVRRTISSGAKVGGKVVQAVTSTANQVC